MPVLGDPPLEVVRAEPDVEVVLFGIVAISVQSLGVALDVGDEVRHADLVDEAHQVPLPVAARLVAELRVEQVAGAMPDAVAARIGNAFGLVARAAIDDVAADDL